MRKMNLGLGLLATVALLAAPAALGQQKDPRTNGPVAPIPPLSTESSSKTPVDPAAAPQGSSQAGAPLTGIDGAGLGGGWSGRTFLVPSFSFESFGETNSRGNGVSGGGSFSGRLALQRLWGRNTFTSDYSGSSRYTYHPNSQNEMFHNWQMAYRVNMRRVGFSLSNSLGYSPQGGTGGGFFNPMMNSGSGFGNSQVVNLNPFSQQNQAIFGGSSSRITNSSSGQVTLQTSSRSLFTFSGNYGIMRFLNPGFFDSNNYGTQIGYNRTLSSRDTLATSYSYSAFQFSDGLRGNQSHTAHFTYGRTISSRMTFQVSAGPEFSLVQISPASEVWQISANIRSSLNYRMERVNLGLAYLRGMSGGAGFFRGAASDEVTASFSRPITRQWTGSGSFGYALNRSLADLATGGIGGRRFNTWRGGLNVGRPLGRQTQMFFRYGWERQDSTNVGCTGATCAFIGTRQTFGLGFNFSFNSIELN